MGVLVFLFVYVWLFEDRRAWRVGEWADLEVCSSDECYWGVGNVYNYGQTNGSWMGQVSCTSRGVENGVWTVRGMGVVGRWERWSLSTRTTPAG